MHPGISKQEGAFWKEAALKSSSGMILSECRDRAPFGEHLESGDFSYAEQRDGQGYCEGPGIKSIVTGG